MEPLLKSGITLAAFHSMGTEPDCKDKLIVARGNPRPPYLNDSPRVIYFQKLIISCGSSGPYMYKRTLKQNP